MKKILFLLALPLALAGCSSSSIINLTPSRLPRAGDGTCHLEAAWRSTEYAIRPDSIKPSVVVGLESYPMRPELVVKDRWEAFVPMPADETLLHYRFRFDFSRDTIPAPVADNKWSPGYTLEIIDKPAEAK